MTEKLKDMLEPSVEGLGYELLHIEHDSQQKNNILRFYIDAPGGIQLDDCETVSRHLSAILDVEDPVDMKYLLEVSSPGLDRPLVKPEHFKQFIGEQARIIMRSHVLGRKKFTGQMVAVDNEGVTIEVDGESYDLAYTNMELSLIHI